MGYLEMTRRLSVRHNIVVRRDTVMRAMQVVDYLIRLYFV